MYGYTFKKLKYSVAIGMALGLTGLAPAAYASGFQLLGEAVSMLGSADAGAVSEADDATTAYFNPAGMVRLPQAELAFSGLGELSGTTFKGTVTAPGTSPFPAFLPSSPYSATGTAYTRTAGVIPSFFWAAPAIPNWVAVGLSVTFPYGLGADYSDTSLVRYIVSQEVAATFDVAPSVAVRLNKYLSIAAGPDIEYFYTDTEVMVRTQPLTTADSHTDTNIADIGKGWHVGALLELTPSTRLGAAYRSEIGHHLEGHSDFDLPEVNIPFFQQPPMHIVSNAVAVDEVIPPMTSVSLYQDITSRWAVMGEADYTQWNIFNKIHISNAPSPVGPQNATVTEQFHNGWHFAEGTSFQLTPKWKLRGGVGENQTVTNPVYLNSTIPVMGNVSVYAGAHYQQTARLGWDALYNHVFQKDANIAYIDPTSGVTEVGKSSLNSNAVGVQMDWNFA